MWLFHNHCKSRYTPVFSPLARIFSRAQKFASDGSSQVFSPHLKKISTGRSQTRVRRAVFIIHILCG